MITCKAGMLLAGDKIRYQREIDDIDEYHDSNHDHDDDWRVGIVADVTCNYDRFAEIELHDAETGEHYTYRVPSIREHELL